MDWIVGISGFVAGILAHAVYSFQVQRAAYSRYMREKGSRSNAKQAEFSDRMSAAIVEAAAMYKEGKKPMEILKELAPKYPDVALQLVKKFGKGDLKGLF